MDGQTALVFNLIIGLAATISSLTGFGHALVATPFLVLLFPPQQAVPVVMISWVPLAALLVKESWGRMNYCRIGRWLVGSVLGIPLGVYGLAHIEEGTMRAAIGALTLIAALTLGLKPAHPLRREGLLAPLVGFASGVMGGASGMSGPPVILFGLNQGWDHRELRANLIGYFVAKHALVLLLLQKFGILDGKLLLLGAASLPGLFAGYLIGIRLEKRISQQHFRLLALALVGLGGLLALVRH